MSFLYSSTRNDMLQCFVCSPIPKVSEKKWATGQSFIRKEITSYRIGTLDGGGLRGIYLLILNLGVQKKEQKDNLLHTTITIIYCYALTNLDTKTPPHPI